MRLPIAMSVVLFMTPACADCHHLALGGTTQGFIDTLKPRLEKFGAVFPLEHVRNGEEDTFWITSTNYYVYTITRDEELFKVGAGVLSQHSDDEVDSVLKVTAIAVSRVSAEFESDVVNELHNGYRMIPKFGTWYKDIGQAFTTITVLNNGSIVTGVVRCAN